VHCNPSTGWTKALEAHVWLPGKREGGGRGESRGFGPGRGQHLGRAGVGGRVHGVSFGTPTQAAAVTFENQTQHPDTSVDLRDESMKLVRRQMLPPRWNKCARRKHLCGEGIPNPAFTAHGARTPSTPQGPGMASGAPVAFSLEVRDGGGGEAGGGGGVARGQEGVGPVDACRGERPPVRPGLRRRRQPERADRRGGGGGGGSGKGSVRLIKLVPSKDGEIFVAADRDEIKSILLGSRNNKNNQQRATVFAPNKK